MQASKAPMTLAYWNARGRVEVLRLLLEYTGLAYTEKIYDFSERDNWFGTEKNQAGFAFPNLPYLIDGEKKITETDAIMTYICQKGNRRDLLGKEDMDIVHIATLRGVLKDLFLDLGMTYYSPSFDKIKEENLKAKVHPRLENFSKFLGTKEYFVGSISVADFMFYHTAMLIPGLDKNIYDKYPNLKGLVERIEALPGIKAYQSSERNKPRSFFGPTCANNITI